MTRLRRGLAGRRGIRFLAASVLPVLTSVFTGCAVALESSAVNTGKALGAMVGSGFTEFSLAKFFVSNKVKSALSLAP